MEEAISPLEHAKESLMLGLRLREGVDLKEVEGRTGLNLWNRLEGVAQSLDRAGLIRLDPAAGGRLRPTPQGLALLHRVILRLFEALEG